MKGRQSPVWTCCDQTMKRGFAPVTGDPIWWCRRCDTTVPRIRDYVPAVTPSLKARILGMKERQATKQGEA